MKSFLTIFVFIATIAQLAFGQCGSECNPSLNPNEVRQGKLELVAINDFNNEAIKYQIGGTVIIESDCIFRVKDFYLYPPTAAAKWYGAASKESTQGINLSSRTVDPVAQNNPVELVYDVSELQFCKASLLKDVGVVRLLDQNDQLIAQAVVYNGKIEEKPSSANGTSTNGKSTSSANSTKLSVVAIVFSALLSLFFF